MLTVQSPKRSNCPDCRPNQRSVDRYPDRLSAYLCRYRQRGCRYRSHRSRRQYRDLERVINHRSRIHDAGFPPKQHPDNAAAPHIGSDVVTDASSPPSAEDATTTAFNNTSLSRSCLKMAPFCFALPNLLKLKRSGSDLFGPNTLVFHDHAGAGVPAQDGVVVFRRPYFFCAIIRIHGVPQLLVDHKS
jgi:hypothetical protein